MVQIPAQYLAEIVGWLRRQDQAASAAREKRRQPRVTVSARVKVGDPQTGREFVAVTRDLSVGGLGLIQSVMAVRGALFDVNLPRAREAPLKVRCRVTYASQWADGVWAVGAQFVSLVTPKPVASASAAHPPLPSSKLTEAQRIQRELLS